MRRYIPDRLTELDRRRERHLTEYRRQVAAGKSTASIALEEVERVDRERDEQRRAVEAAEAIRDEWAGPPDRDAALDLYTASATSWRARWPACRGSRIQRRAS